MLMFTWNGERWALLFDALYHYDWDIGLWLHVTETTELRSVH